MEDNKEVKKEDICMNCSRYKVNMFDGDCHCEKRGTVFTYVDKCEYFEKR